MENAQILSQEIFQAALAAVDPARLVIGAAPSIVRTLSEKGLHRLLVLSCGKAGAVMANALEAALPDRIEQGLVITKYGHAAGYPCRRCRVSEAGHPLPDPAGAAATATALEMVDAAGTDTLLVVLLSGGGSALLVAPAPGLTLEDKQRTTDLLLRSGAEIGELNTVRKHLSAVKGGQLARRAWPATVMTLILSDVIGDPLDVIASGPTAADPSSYADALAVLERRKLADIVPSAVLAHLRLGATGERPDTPKPGDPVLARVVNRILGNNRFALEAAAAAARSRDLTVTLLTDTLRGEARQAARWLAEQARAARAAAPPGRRLCLLAGGETTVTVTGSGKGGRNQELALAFALEVAGENGLALLSAGTDGNDGPTDAAGAFADGRTVATATAAGLSAREYLAANDAYHFFDRCGGLLRTGPTGTNVMDLQIVLVEGGK